MNIPVMCSYLSAISHLNLDYFIHNCFLGDEYKKVFNQHFSYDIKNGTIVGFSDLKNTSDIQRSHGHIASTVYKYAKRYKTMEEAKETKEHDVIFDTNEQRYHLEILHNQTLAN